MLKNIHNKHRNQGLYGFSLMRSNGFSLIELLVVISIIGVLVAMSIFGLNGARVSARDAKRKADLEGIRSGLELYKADCNYYPVSARLNLSGVVNLRGDGSTSSCLAANSYISASPLDPTSPTANYLYRAPASANTYELCAYLEGGGATVTCGGSSACGSRTCNYKVTQP